MGGNKVTMKTIQGIIRESDYGENWNTLFIGDMDKPIAEWWADEIGEATVTVRYWISKEARSREQLTEDTLLRISGAVEAQYEEVYSEVTGYLWTNEALVVGGHELLDELAAYEGKFLYMEIEIH
jgi:hypothetical protein